MTLRVVISATLLIVLLLSTTAAGLSAQSQGTPEPGSYCADEAETEMLRRINQLRDENGLEALELSQPLGTASQVKASEMAEQDYLAHESPDGQTPRELLEQIGYTYNTTIGENIAAGQEGAESTFEQWLNSPEHREIMLGEEFNAVGIGRAHNADANYDWYWAAEFGGEVGEPAQSCDSATPESTPVRDEASGSSLLLAG